MAGAVPLALALANEGGHQRWLIAVFGPLTGWAFIGTGILVWLRRPENRVGALMTAVGFSACLAALRVSTEPWIFITGLLTIALQWALLYHLLLAFPSGILRSNLERGLVVGDLPERRGRSTRCRPCCSSTRPRWGCRRTRS